MQAKQVETIIDINFNVNEMSIREIKKLPGQQYKGEGEIYDKYLF